VANAELGHVMGFAHVDGSEGYVLSPILDAGERLSFDARTEAPVDRGPANPPGPRTPQAETQVFIEHLGAFVPAPLATLINQTGTGKSAALGVRRRHSVPGMRRIAAPASAVAMKR